MAALYRRVARNNVFAWSERFLASIRSASDARLERPSGTPEPLPVEGLRQAFEAAPKRLLLLDYDGTLAPYARRPQDAVPPRGVLSLLERLARHPANCVALVSGRMRADLEAWFGAIPNLWLAAEHGAILRSPEERAWEAIRRNVPVDWKATVLPILEHFADRTPGSFIEEKEYALVFHYRMSDPVFGEWLANELCANLEELLAETELRAIRGQKSVEVRLVWANKGEMVSRVEAALPNVDFRMAVGDDRTDEDLFERLPPDAWTVHVGEGTSHARFCLSGPREVCDVLDQLARSAQELS